MIAAIPWLEDVVLVDHLGESVHELQGLQVGEDPVNSREGDVALGCDGPVGVLSAHQLHEGVHDLLHKVCESALGVHDASSIEPESYLVDRSGVEVAKHEGDVRVLVWNSMEYLL